MSRPSSFPVLALDWCSRTTNETWSCYTWKLVCKVNFITFVLRIANKLFPKLSFVRHKATALDHLMRTEITTLSARRTRWFVYRGVLLVSIYLILCPLCLSVCLYIYIYIYICVCVCVCVCVDYWWCFRRISPEDWCYEHRFVINNLFTWKTRKE